MCRTKKCAYCGEPAQGNYNICRDGFGVGPTVELCDECGEEDFPSCEQIWEKIAQPSTEELSYRKPLCAESPKRMKPVLLN
jgi:hypothetical protein